MKKALTFMAISAATFYVILAFCYASLNPADYSILVKGFTVVVWIALNAVGAAVRAESNESNEPNGC